MEYESIAKVPRKTATTERGPPIYAKNGLFWQMEGRVLSRPQDFCN